MSRRPIEPRIRSAADPDRRPADDLRAALAYWPSGVCVVTVRSGPRVHGLTVSAFSALSLEPPLVLVCIDEQSPLLDYLQEARRFSVNLLAEDQKRSASVFADRFPVGGPSFPEEGDPVLPGALATLICSLEAVHPGGDHRIIVGAVERVELRDAAAPLLYYRREYRKLS